MKHCCPTCATSATTTTTLSSSSTTVLASRYRYCRAVPNPASTSRSALSSRRGGADKDSLAVRRRAGSSGFFEDSSSPGGGDDDSPAEKENGASGSNGSGGSNGRGGPLGNLPGNLVDAVTALPENFSIIESSEEIKDFGRMDIKDLRDNIAARRNTIFLLMEEVRRLRIQVRVKDGDSDAGGDSAAADPDDLDERYSSAIPFLPPIGADTLKYYYWVYAIGVSSLVLFGGLIAPALEVRLGIGGLSYLEFIESIGLPRQLALVDPIVASFVGGAVGVLSALLVVEVNNFTEREKEKCFYCEGSGYLACGMCGGRGEVAGEPCPTCSGTGKVMCTTCLCTGRLMATEHDPRIDPFV